MRTGCRVLENPADKKQKDLGSSRCIRSTDAGVRGSSLKRDGITDTLGPTLKSPVRDGMQRPILECTNVSNEQHGTVNGLNAPAAQAEQPGQVTMMAWDVCAWWDAAPSVHPERTTYI